MQVFRNQQGSAMNVALLILLLITVIVIFMNRTSTIDMEVAGNERYAKTAFYITDSGIFASPKVITAVIENGGVNSLPAGSPISFSDPAPYNNPVPATDGLTAAQREVRFHDELYGFAGSIDDTKDPGDNDMRSPDIGFTVDGTKTVTVDIRRTGQEHLVGGGAEFATGSSGIGSGATGGVAILYNLDSMGAGPKNAAANIVANYRKVPGTAGGL